MKTLAIVLFIATYVLLLSLPKIRAYIALGSAALFVLLGILPIGQVVDAVDWNVVLMIAGTMGVVSLFIESKMPSLLADHIIDRTPNVMWTIVALSLFSGVISAFIDNVATVLMVAPVAITIAKKLKISPVKSIIAISISSNLQGAATLVGDTTSILLGGYADMTFVDFFFFKGKIGMFWVVEMGALAATLILIYFLRNEKQPIKMSDRTKVEDYVPTILLVSIVVLLIIASFIPNRPELTNGLICFTLCFIGVVRKFIIKKDTSVFTDVLKEMDFTTIMLLIGLFIVIGGMTEAGVVEEISNLFIRVSGDNLFLIYTLLVWGSVVCSAFIDNIPFVATMLPVTAQIATTLGIDPYILYFGLLTGATLGGNITPVGASANIAGLGILRKAGYEVSAGEFMKLSVPFTLAAVIVGYIMIWFIWR